MLKSLESLRESVAAIRDCVDANRLRENRRFIALWKQPRELSERDDVAFHYFYAGRIFSICRHGILSKNEMNRRGWTDEAIKPTHTPICEGQDHYSQIWFSNVDYSTAVHMPPFMRHSRNGDLWGLGAARVVIDQAGLSLWVDFKQSHPKNDLSPLLCKWFTFDGPEVPPSSFIRVEYYDLYSGEWLVFPHKT